MTVNNTNGVTLNADASVANTLTLTNGWLSVGTRTLTLGAGATVTGISNTLNQERFIIADDGGQVCKQYSGNGSFSFPIGDDAGTLDYSPATLNFTSGTFSDGQACLKVVDAKHPNVGTGAHITRYWDVTTTGISGFSCAVTFTYVDADVTGTESDMSGAKWNGSQWTLLGAVTPATNTFSGNVTSFSQFTAGLPGALAVRLASFSGDLVDGLPVLTWETVSEQDNAGFNVYRAESASGPWVKINERLIAAAAPGSAEARAYRWTDAGFERGAQRWYLLEDVDLNGTATRHGPVQIGQDGQTAPNAVNVSGFSARIDWLALLRTLLGNR